MTLNGSTSEASHSFPRTAKPARTSGSGCVGQQVGVRRLPRCFEGSEVGGTLLAQIGLLVRVRDDVVQMVSAIGLADVLEVRATQRTLVSQPPEQVTLGQALALEEVRDERLPVERKVGRLLGAWSRKVADQSIVTTGVSST